MNRLMVRDICCRIAPGKRYASSYLTKSWSPQPFKIGYPFLDPQLQQQKQEIFNLLFSQDNLCDEDIHRVDLSLAELKELGRNKIRFINPRPKRLKGEQLYQVQFQHQTSYYSKTLWRKLPHESQLKLIGSPNLDVLYNESVRIWKGYEVVEYLKRNSQEHRFNPYPLSGLYPWEIIKDKLRKKISAKRKKRPILEFEWDYYDQLIKEAFGPHGRRSAIQFYYTNLQSRYPDQKYTLHNVQNQFNLLPIPIRQIFYDAESRYQDQTILSSERPTTVHSRPFRVFYNQYITNNNYEKRQLLNAITLWKSMDPVEKKSYSRLRQCKYHKYKEDTLDLKTAIVMDYIYYVGGVEGIDIDDFDWYQDMKSRINGFTYLNRCYTEIL